MPHELGSEKQHAEAQVATLVHDSSELLRSSVAPEGQPPPAASNASQLCGGSMQQASRHPAMPVAHAAPPDAAPAPGRRSVPAKHPTPAASSAQLVGRCTQQAAAHDANESQAALAAGSAA
jgi:hypothetical protein